MYLQLSGNSDAEGVDLSDDDHGVRIFLKLFDDRSAVFLLIAP